MGKKVRDSNLSKTFHLDISKEALEHMNLMEITKGHEPSKSEQHGADEELHWVLPTGGSSSEGTGRNTGESDGREGRVQVRKSEDERDLSWNFRKRTHSLKMENRGYSSRITKCKKKCRSRMPKFSR